MKNSYDIIKDFLTELNNIKDLISQHSKRLGISQDAALILIFLSITENKIIFPEKLLNELKNNALITEINDEKIELTSKGKIIAKSLCDALKK